MSDLITDAMVETAAQIMWDTATGPGNWDELPEDGRDLECQAMRAALEAVAPLIAAKALRDAADEVRDYAYQPDDVSGPFPADQQPAYLAGATDAHHVVDRLLKGRADRFEREGVR